MKGETVMDEEIMQKGFERYLVTFKDGSQATIKASSFVDVLAELRESNKDEEDVVDIEKLDWEE